MLLSLKHKQTVSHEWWWIGETIFDFPKMLAEPNLNANSQWRKHTQEARERKATEIRLLLWWLGRGGVVC